MFHVGDKILYPMYGAGVIEAIEEKEVLGQSQLYYILNIPHINMKVMVPIYNSTNLNIREVVEPEIIDGALQNINNGNTDPVIFDDRRSCNEINKKRIKSGDIYRITEIIRDLTRKSKRNKNKLGMDDANMLNTARQIFASEVVQVKGITQEQAVNLLNKVIDNQAVNA
ncbi:CarD family transcriptional regulator [Desulfitobacterium sp.]|uniref:CarD family transcriptional regulator n=1 Tax=Desulfitobacterium sp. TaxID=49981 RepID=UPI002B21D6D8|nr:CarD family transcriptional regulator [Desulfitobacterium sp.]MEA4903164.1 CarD family transcriptional regulator [Desulfitobacterium sp.]